MHFSYFIISPYLKPAMRLLQFCVLSILLVLVGSAHAQQLSVLFVGDLSFGENYQAKLEAKNGVNTLKTRGYNRPLSKFRPLLLSVDHVVANLETPLTDLVNSPLKHRKKYLHWGDPNRTATTLWHHNIRHLSLANNHTLDYGRQGLRHTLKALNSHKIKYFGAGENDEKAGQALRIKRSLKPQGRDIIILAGFTYHRNYVKDYDFYATETKSGVKLWSQYNVAALLQHLRRDNPNAFIVAYPHWGKNYRWKDPAQTEMGHRIIDAGADLIIGHGAHRLQEIEQYNGRWIIYNLGNFMFLSPGRYQFKKVTPYSLIAQLEVTDTRQSLKLYPIYTDNLKTNYQPRFVTENEFIAARDELLNHSVDAKALDDLITYGSDRYGQFLSLRIR